MHDDRTSLTKVCDCCGRRFAKRRSEPPARWQARRFCSRVCANVSRRHAPATKVCLVCGVNFSRRAGEGDERWANRKLCGHACRGAFNSRGIIERLEHYRKINEDTGCWVWTGAEHGNGYASMTVAGRRAYVHRVSHEQYIGPIPDGFDVDHLCFNRLCFNPEHLQAVTRAENGNYPLTVEPDSENIRSHGKQDDAPDEENDDSTHFDPELYELEVEAAAELEESLSSGDSDD